MCKEPPPCKSPLRSDPLAKFRDDSPPIWLALILSALILGVIAALVAVATFMFQLAPQSIRLLGQ